MEMNVKRIVMDMFKKKEIIIVFKSYEEDNNFFLCDYE